ncbi:MULTISPECIES: hypothetical protein [unclassified Microbacterium]|uniref:hypothetical protein n=1 Tax=unclassified Microbacterium TaxID=2609290 RepID=UPI00301A4507
MPEELVALVEAVTAHLGDIGRALVQQARVAKVVSYSSTNVDVITPPDVPEVALPNGPTPGQALVYTEGQMVGEVMVWVRDGRFIGLEQPWYTDDPPTMWPVAEQVRVEP